MALPKQVEVTVPIANIRNAPIVATSSDIGDVIRGAKLDVIGETEEFWETRTYLAKSVSKPIIVPLPPTVPEYQVWGDKKKGFIRSAAPNPEVYWLDDSPVRLTKPWQELIFKMNQPYMTEKWFTQNLASNVAWANGTGFLEAGDPRNNYITGVMGAKDPYLDKCRCCQMRLHGTESNGILTVEVLDGNQPPPSWEWLEPRTWLWFIALIVLENGSTINFPYCGGDIPVKMPLVGIPPVQARLNYNLQDKPVPYITRIYT